MVDVSTSIEINCPWEIIADYASNPDNAPFWYVNIKSVRWITSRPLQKGSLIEFTAHFLGRKMSYIYEIVEWAPNEKLVMISAEGPFPMNTLYTWVKLENNIARMTLRNTGHPSGFFRLFTPFLSLAMKKANKKDLIRLKKILEKPQLT